MGLLDRFFKKKEQPEFTKVEGDVLTLENQNGCIENPTRVDLKNYLNCLFDEDDQFVTLSLPQAKDGVRFIQATFAGTKLIVQLGLEENNKTRLVEKECVTGGECTNIFYQFYDFGIVDRVSDYTPVQF